MISHVTLVKKVASQFCIYIHRSVGGLDRSLFIIIYRYVSGLRFQF